MFMLFYKVEELQLHCCVILCRYKLSILFSLSRADDAESLKFDSELQPFEVFYSLVRVN